MAINERIITGTTAAAADGGGTGNQEEGLILHLDANDVDSYDGDGSVWYDITNHEYTPAVDPADHFNTVLFTGDNASSRGITGVGFQPDLVWIKDREATKWHMAIDSVRGANKLIYPNETNTEYTASPTILHSFDSDGFTVGYRSQANSVASNVSGQDYVAWCFKAGGAPTASNSGGQTPTSGSKMVDGTAVTDNYPTADIYPKKQSVNTKLGFSITEYDGAGSGKTLPHGLDAFPELYIIKTLDTAGNWWAYTVEGGDFQYLKLNASDSAIDADQYYDRPTAELVEQGQTLNDRSVMYAFASKRGVSKVGSYEGNSSSAGVKVYTGFEPAWIMFKPADASTGWSIHDNKRGLDKQLNPDIPNSETTGWSAHLEFHSDGFKVKGNSGGLNPSSTMIYLAFAAEKPNSLIDDTDLELHLDAGNTDSYDPDTDGSTWSDLTAGNHNATLTSMNASQHDKEIGGWFDFDGSNDFGTISHNTSLDLSSSGFTAEAWIYYTDSNLNMILDKGTVSRGYGYNLQINANNLDLRIHATGGTGATIKVLGTETLTANKWNHVAFTLSDLSSSATAVTYVNGVQDGTDSGNLTSYTNTSNLLIGSSAYNTTDRFDGKIGQVRLYSTALTADEVMQNYRFTKNDYPNGLNGTFNGLTSSDWNSSGYFDFPTGTDRIDLDFDGIDFNQTLVMWVNLGANTNADSNSTYRYYLYSQYTGSNYQYFNVAMYDKSSGGNHLNITWRDSSSSYYFLEDDVDTDFGSGWNMVAVYISGTESVYYSINGNNWTQATLGFGDLGTEDVIPSGNVILSGYRGNTSIVSQANPFSMSQLKVYDKVLTSSELSALNTAGYQG